MDRTTRFAGLLTAGMAVGASGWLVLSGDASAAPRKSGKAAVVGRVDVPLGLQGYRGAGPEVVVPFTLIDSSRATTDVEVEYGVDRSASGSAGAGSISDDEYRRCTEDRLDSRNTRKNKKPQKYSTAGDIGASHAFVWSSAADVFSGRHETLMYQYTPQGRAIPDPDNPGSFLFATNLAGVKVRVRAVKGKGATRAVGQWYECGAGGPGEPGVPFSLNNNSPPSMTIDAVLPNATSVPTASDEQVVVKWTARDADSEDLDGENDLDALAGEDRNGDGILQQEYVGVAFDYYRVQAGENPATMSDTQIAELDWRPCTRAAGFGDTDALPSSYPPANNVPGQVIYGTPNGRQWSFAWNSVADVGTVRDSFILRAQVTDQKYEQGATVYLRTPFLLDNWRVFSSAAAGNAAIETATGRVGATVTNLLAGLDRSDGAYPAPFQEFLVAGGATTSAAVNGSDALDVFLVNTETAESVSAQRVAIENGMLSPRSFHTATRLSDGRVLLTGGFDANGVPLSTTEIYDPASRGNPLAAKVTAGPALNTARARHTAVLLPTNDVAIFGGVDATGQVLGSVEIYRFTAHGEALRPVELAVEPLAFAAHSLRAVVLPDQTVLVGGGIGAGGGPLAGAQLFDPMHDDDVASPETKNPRFVKSVGATPLVVNLLEARADATFTGLLDGNVLVTGGSSAGGASKATLEVFDWSDRVFQPVTATLPGGGRAQHAATLLGDGTVVIAGGTAQPGLATPTALPTAAVFEMGAQSGVGAGATWTGQFLPVNGDMVVPRRRAASALLSNGRALFVGGLDTNANPVARIEVYTPEGARNTPPKVYLNLPSGELSWKYGATIHYRLIDAEEDRARVVVQFRNPGESVWNACSSQPDTIGGDIADATADLVTTDQDLEHQDLAIDPVAQNTPGDHVFIWSMKDDIPRPATFVPDYNLRLIPFGGEQGTQAISDPVTVLFNTKPIVAVLPLEDADGTLNPFQGGDVTLWAHVRDIDGAVAASNGDPCSVRFEYAQDKNGDGQITDAEDGGWLLMTPSGFPTGNNTQANPALGVQSWGESAADSEPQFGARPLDKGWMTFNWDALYDLGCPPSTAAYEIRNTWVRVTAIDTNVGFPTLFRNLPGNDQIVIVRDRDALWLQSFAPRGGNKASVKANEPIDFVFNGHVDPASVGPATLRIYRNSTQVLGAYQVTQGATTSTVTFYPEVQSTLPSGSDQYGPNDADTILFAGNQYRIRIAGYLATSAPSFGTTVRPVQSGGETSTFELVHSSNIDGDLDPQFRFTTAAGRFNDGQAVGFSMASPGFGSTLGTATTPFALVFNHAIDKTTVSASTLTVRGDTSDPETGATSWVVPGRWHVTNVVNGDGTSQATLTFTPFFKLPAGSRIVVGTTAGLLGTNGNVATGASGGVFNAPVYARVPFSLTEPFNDATSADPTGTTARYGDDLCNPGVLTGLQDSATPPQGGTNLTIANGQVVTVTGTLVDYGSVTIQRGGRMDLRASGPMTLRIKGDFIVDGTLDFSGADGASGQHGSTVSVSQYYGTTYYGTRAGGVGYNGGGSGGNSTTVNSNYGASTGANGNGGNGLTNAGGRGGSYYTTSPNVTYAYGAAGGGGGAHARAGFVGGMYYYGVSQVHTAGGTPGGTVDFSGGPTGGGGGGGGGSGGYSATTPSYYLEGGAGGAGAGFVHIVTEGAFRLGPTGIVDGSGGTGGGKSHVGGAGGGGAGGGLHLKSGDAAVLHGIIDLRGGRGGPPSYIFMDSYIYGGATAYGTHRHGGDGAPGRLMIEAPNMGSRDEVRVFGALITRQITSLPTTSVGQSSLPSTGVFSVTGPSGNVTHNFGAVTDVRYPSFDIPSGRNVSITNTTGSPPFTTSTNRPIRIWVDGPVNINGQLLLNADGASAAKLNASAGSRWGMPGLGGCSAYNGQTLVTYAGYVGGPGAGAGGRGHGNTSTGAPNCEAFDGDGLTPGKHRFKGTLYSVYFMADTGGSGAGNASPGLEGWNPHSLSPTYNAQGTFSATNADGVTPSRRLSDASVPGVTVDSTTMSVTAIDRLVGSGGGGGNAGGYINPFYFMGYAGIGGGGGGGIVIVSTSTMTVGGRIEAKGGDGNPPGFPTPYLYDSATASYIPMIHAGGGAGSGGTIYLVADVMNVTPATIGEGASANGATFDVTGGTGGGWRQFESGVMNRFPSYNTLGSFGGDGGVGRVVLEYRTSLNNGRTLANRWGNEQSVFHDSREQYRTLSGTAFYKCRGKPGGNTFRSLWYDTGSLRPIMSSMSFGSQANVQTVVLQARGGQSHPSDPGPGGTGVIDTTNLSAFTANNPTGNFLDGWRFFQYSGSFQRLTGSTGLPALDNLSFGGTRDQ